VVRPVERDVDHLRRTPRDRIGGVNFFRLNAWRVSASTPLDQLLRAMTGGKNLEQFGELEPKPFDSSRTAIAPAARPFWISSGGP
jgi:hypothetical protein